MALTDTDLQFAVLGLITFQQNIDLLIDLAASSDHGGLQDFATVLLNVVQWQGLQKHDSSNGG
jgi:hypothetical protein